MSGKQRRRHQKRDNPGVPSPTPNPPRQLAQRVCPPPLPPLTPSPGASQPLPTLAHFVHTAATAVQCFADACEQVAVADDSRGAAASAMAARWIGPLTMRALWSLVAEEHPSDVTVAERYQEVKARFPLEAITEARHHLMKATGHSPHWRAGDDWVAMPVLYSALQDAFVGAVGSAVENADQCLHAVTAEETEDADGLPSLHPKSIPEGILHDVLRGLTVSVHAQTRQNLFDTLEQLLKADFERTEGGMTVDDPLLKPLRDALQLSDTMMDEVYIPAEVVLVERSENE